MENEIAGDIETIVQFAMNKAPNHIKLAASRVESWLATYQDEEVDV